MRVLVRGKLIANLDENQIWAHYNYYNNTRIMQITAGTTSNFSSRLVGSTTSLDLSTIHMYRKGYNFTIKKNQ